ncbi:glycoside hydrolase family 16 protein [Allokutzneria albata]|uniref:Glycosyl hydrolases family 16 n=1 Tax=Allokutzneria albata TaxID=211114 RepID=A0A1G9RJU9_ALLAB|nr:family 16 glycosylhydrolase [Allokutzneria albata]SDM23599.1 Glycosyl hydrolases family 16 [Allokutzneria albata]
MPRAALLATVLIASAAVAAPHAAAQDEPPTSWPTAFADEFDGTEIDRNRWSIHSDAEGDRCLGNKGNNEQLEWHTWNALALRDGKLVMTARKDNPEPGYEWSGALITTAHTCGNGPAQEFQVQPGDYIETRLKLPKDKGFWPSTWTWNGNGSNEQDTYEYYSDNPFRLYFTNHQNPGGQCQYQHPVDLTQDWHTIGQLLGPDQTVWFLDGKEVCRQGAFSGNGALVLDMFVYAKIPPEVTEGSMEIDHVRVHRK